LIAVRYHYWTAEIALPLAQLALHAKAQVPPAANSFWRINFSRVEWPVRVVVDPHTGKRRYDKEAGLGEENWVWSAQYAVDMHRPEWWGYLQFRPQGEAPPEPPHDRPHAAELVPLDPEWGVRYVSFQYYYAQHAFHKATGAYTARLEKLLPYFLSREAIECTSLMDVTATETAFSAQIGLREDSSQFVASIEDDGYISVERGRQASAVATLE
jgi:hypothetical protein